MISPWAEQKKYQRKIVKHDICVTNQVNPNENIQSAQGIDEKRNNDRISDEAAIMIARKKAYDLNGSIRGCYIVHIRWNSPG